MKAAIIFVIVIARRHDFNAVVAGVVYGGLIGVGFACTENVLYYGQAYQATLRVGGSSSQALDAVQQVFVWRGLETPFVHSMFTMMTGPRRRPRGPLPARRRAHPCAGCGLLRRGAAAHGLQRHRVVHLAAATWLSVYVADPAADPVAADRPWCSSSAATSAA